MIVSYVSCSRLASDALPESTVCRGAECSRGLLVVLTVRKESKRHTRGINISLFSFLVSQFALL